MKTRIVKNYWLQNYYDNHLLSCACPWDSFKKRCQGYILYKKTSCLYRPWILLWIMQDLKKSYVSVWDSKHFPAPDEFILNAYLFVVL